MSAPPPVYLASLSAAMDGGFVAIADVRDAMTAIGAATDYRLIGGVAVLLHVQRLGLDLPLRATGDADFGVPLHLLRDPELVAVIEARGYTKVAGNRWERRIDDRRVASVDLLIPAYTSRARHTRRVGDIVTTEVPGLAVALRRPAIAVDTRFRLTNGDVQESTIALPDAFAMVTLKALVRSVRHEDRDAQDLWRCLEIAAAEGITPRSWPENPAPQSSARFSTASSVPGAPHSTLLPATSKPTRRRGFEHGSVRSSRTSSEPLERPRWTHRLRCELVESARSFVNREHVLRLDALDAPAPCPTLRQTNRGRLQRRVQPVSRRSVASLGAAAHAMRRPRF